MKLIAIIFSIFLFSLSLHAQLIMPRPSCSAQLAMQINMHNSFLGKLPMKKTKRTWEMYQAAEHIIEGDFRQEDENIIKEIQDKINKMRPPDWSLDLFEVAQAINTADKKREFCSVEAEDGKTSFSQKYIKEITEILVERFAMDVE